MKTSRLTRYIGMALAGCFALLAVPATVWRTVCRTAREFECQAVAMTRLNLTLAHWRNCADVAAQVMRPDMRASSNGAVFNNMPEPMTMRKAC